MPRRTSHIVRAKHYVRIEVRSGSTQRLRRCDALPTEIEVAIREDLSGDSMPCMMVFDANYPERLLHTVLPVLSGQLLKVSQRA
jgi:hypothetical protein